jgi:hypothetical protein
MVNGAADCWQRKIFAPMLGDPIRGAIFTVFAPPARRIDRLVMLFFRLGGAKLVELARVFGRNYEASGRDFGAGW